MSSAQVTPSSLTNAIEFLTRPLLMIYAPTKVLSLQMLLQTALSALFTQRRGPRMTLSISQGSVAPRALYPSCTAAGIRWADWFSLLGGKEFDLIIDEFSVVVRVGSAKTTIWTQTPSTSDSIAATTTTTTTRQTLQATLNSAIARARTRTLAQLILESPDEDKETDELFACISKASVAIVSPTPTRDVFPSSITNGPFIPFVPRGNMGEALAAIPEDLSRPSSRSSQSSASSSSSTCFSAVSDSTSATSVSSSPISTHKLVPAITSVQIHNQVVPILRAPQVPNRARKPIVVEDELDEMTAPVHIDASKKDVTKYLYQGGVSTVLTGGVMLGGTAKTTPKKRNAPSSGSGNWRRF